MTAETFADFKLLKSLQKAVAAEQYRQPTPIQLSAIPKIMMGRDVLGIAQTGTGKTAAFVLPILHRLGKNKHPQLPRCPRVLVLTPTRELATQVTEQFQLLGHNMHLKLCTVFGGVGQQPQVRAVKRGVHVMVATPGRLLDLLNQGHIDLEMLGVFVLDEADRMLDMGFLPDIKKIVRLLPEKRQSLFFSATMPSRIQELADALLTKPVRIDVTPDDSSTSTADDVKQSVMFVEHRKKKSLISHLFKQRITGRALVFTRTKHGASRLSRELNKRGFESDSIHGDRTQNARTRVLQAFKSGTVPILVATEVAARGIDVDGIRWVINYDLPADAESYVHRIGRTGRAGASGIAVTFCNNEEVDKFKAIERALPNKLTVDESHPYHVPGLA